MSKDNKHEHSTIHEVAFFFYIYRIQIRNENKSNWSKLSLFDLIFFVNFFWALNKLEYRMKL